MNQNRQNLTFDIPHKKYHDLSDVRNPSKPISLNLMSPLAHVQAGTVHCSKKTTESASQKVHQEYSTGVEVRGKVAPWYITWAGSWTQIRMLLDIYEYT